jgi:hypothetical protein
MVFHVILSALLILSSTGLGEPDRSNAPRLSLTQAALLTQWYEGLGKPETKETFGDFLVRAARLKHGSPYTHIRETEGLERLRVDLTRFDCVSLVDSSLAVARCAWLRDTTEACFLRELVATRYRDGMMGDFASRLHYLEDWFDDNGERNRLRDRTRDLGGLLLRRHFSYMSEHPDKYPAMNDSVSREAIERTEARLSRRVYSVITKSTLRGKEELLRNGDLVGIVTTEPGRLIGHAGFVVRDKRGKTHLLHASSYHRRVVVTIRGLTDYLLRRSERWGIIVARPRAPASSRALTAEGQTH